MPNVADIANEADMIVDGYAFILRKDASHAQRCESREQVI